MTRTRPLTLCPVPVRPRIDDAMHSAITGRERKLEKEE